MVKIFYYELRRLLGNRFTVGLLLVALLYGYWTMRGEILLGIANTAQMCIRDRAITWAKVVFPTPGGPQKIIEAS